MDDIHKQRIIMCFLGIIPVVWLALIIAPYVNNGLIDIIKNTTIALDNPLNIKLCENSLKTIFFFLLIYGISVGVYMSTRKNYRRNEEYGSAKWGNAKKICKKYKEKKSNDNVILTQNFCMGLDGRKHRRNLNILVCGGSGAGKTRSFAKVNLCQCNTSFVV